MSNVAEFGKKVKDQEKKWMENVSWVVGIDMGKEKLFCALMNVKKELICRFDVACSLAGYNELLNRVKKEVRLLSVILFDEDGRFLEMSSKQTDLKKIYPNTVIEELKKRVCK